MAKTENRREFMHLAHVYKPEKDAINGWFYSEKLDGMRCFWDGGITRGMYASDVPFANTGKDGHRLAPPKATGLWSRYGKPVQAPSWFLDELPGYALDGELYTGRGNFQQTMSICRTQTPDNAQWEKVTFKVFDLPDYSRVFQDGTINVPNWTQTFKGVMDWLKMQKRYKEIGPKLRRFETVVFLLEKAYPHDGVGVVQSAQQTQLPFNTPKAMEILDAEMKRITNLDGEGIIVRHPGSIWEPQRSHHCLKIKPFDDAEVIVLGYISGRETERGSKLLGLLGAMIVDFNGKRLELSGFDNAERVLSDDTTDGVSSYRQAQAFEWCVANPGMEVPPYIVSRHFPRGSKITVKYRELTDSGLPKECRYWRKRPQE